MTENTRTRILRVALELFTEQGYEKTSLREVAERLGVTKAALYYHFKSKEEIVDGFVEERVAQIEALADWLAGQPRTVQTRQEFVRRYAEDLSTAHHLALMRFFESNQTALRGMAAGIKMRDRLQAVMSMLVDPTAPLAAQLRTALGFWVLHTSWFILRDAAVTDEERAAAALEVARELVA